MFNMTQVGINISKMRKSKGLTQMELADKLGISFQAVSNWERGISMPDISKLGELSALFDVSTDEILGSGRISEIAKNLGFTESKVKTALMRTRNALKEFLEREDFSV